MVLTLARSIECGYSIIASWACLHTLLAVGREELAVGVVTLLTTLRAIAAIATGSACCMRETQRRFVQRVTMYTQACERRTTQGDRQKMMKRCRQQYGKQTFAYGRGIAAAKSRRRE